MTNEEKMAKRVALASDVLARLNAEELFPGFGNYCVRSNKGCEVCATGALLVACCGIPDPGRSPLGVDECMVVECLEEFFDTEELAVIEAAFERRIDAPIRELCDVEPTGIDAAVAMFRGSNRTDESAEAQRRMRIIMENIVTNGGEFRP